MAALTPRDQGRHAGFTYTTETRGARSIPAGKLAALYEAKRENDRLREALSDAAEVIREHECRLSHTVGECYLCEIVYEADLLTREE